MPTAQLAPTPFVPSDEQIAQIIERLAQRYPRERIALADLETLVRNSYHEFDAAAVRTFVAILTERLVRHHIEEP